MQLEVSLEQTFGNVLVQMILQHLMITGKGLSSDSVGTLLSTSAIGVQCWVKYFLKVFQNTSMKTCWKKYLKYSEKYKY